MRRNHKAIFLDKDGTLVSDVPYNYNPDLIFLSDEMIDGLQMLTAAGFKLIVISNQSGIALGYFDWDKLQIMEQALTKKLANHRISIDGYYYCPHHPDGVIAAYKKKCDCRKPAIGMFKQAAADHYIALSNSWMIGDILDDVQAGNSAGCKTVLINNGNETEWLNVSNRLPNYIAPNINTAAKAILNGLTVIDKNKIKM